MDKREALKSMLNNMINDKPEQAALDLHGYFTAKMQDIAGLTKNTTETDVVEIDPEASLETE